MKKIIPIMFFYIGLAVSSQAQSIENTGWFFLTHKQTISKRFDLLVDLQARSADQYAYLNTLLIRGGLNYNFNDHHAVALGYAYKGDWMQEGSGKSYSPENRIYQQYLGDFKAGRTEINARFRLEQRFVKEDDVVEFSQRARIMFSIQIPLLADSKFEKGLSTTLQNELFLNVHHKERVNNDLFDQYRPYLSLGYRVSKSLDIEGGYMYWLQREGTETERTNVLQIMLTTKL